MQVQISNGATHFSIMFSVPSCSRSSLTCSTNTTPSGSPEKPSPLTLLIREDSPLQDPLTERSEAVRVQVHRGGEPSPFFTFHTHCSPDGGDTSGCTERSYSTAVETQTQILHKLRLSVKRQALKSRIGERKERRNAMSEGSGNKFVLQPTLRL